MTDSSKASLVLTRDAPEAKRARPRSEILLIVFSSNVPHPHRPYPHLSTASSGGHVSPIYLILTSRLDASCHPRRPTCPFRAYTFPFRQLYLCMGGVRYHPALHQFLTSRSHRYRAVLFSHMEIKGVVYDIIVSSSNINFEPHAELFVVLIS